MPKNFEFATGGSGGGAEGKKINVTYPPEVQRKLDDALGVVEKAGSAAERAAALKAYKRLVDVAGAEQQERMKLVDFRGEQIHNFELQALKKIVEQINEDYAEQRKVDPRFELGDVGIEDLEVEVEDGKVVRIDLDGRKLKKIPEAIGDLVNLKGLYFDNNQITEISGLESLIDLQTLSFSCNQITEINGVESLIKLQSLWLGDNQITEISGLERLINLQELGLGSNQITEISGLKKLIGLQRLWLPDNQITEISGLEGLTSLRELGLDGNQIIAICGLEKLVELQALYLNDNQITEISGLKNLAKLQTLFLDKNSINRSSPINDVELERLKKSGVDVVI